MTIVYVGAERKDGKSVHVECEVCKNFQNMHVGFVTGQGIPMEAKIRSIGFIINHLDPNDPVMIMTGDDVLAKEIRQCLLGPLTRKKNHVRPSIKALMPGMARFKYPVDIRGKSAIDHIIWEKNTPDMHSLEVRV